MRSLGWVLLFGGLALAGGKTSVNGQQPDEKPSAAEELPVQVAQQPDKKQPPVEVIGKQPVETPSLPPTQPQPPQIPQGIQDFSFNGSPLFNPNANVPDFGPQRSIFEDPRPRTDLDRARIFETQSGSVPQILEGIPGVMIQRTNGGGGSLIIRGRNGNQNLIMVDGVPINDAGWRFSNVQYLNTIDPGVIDHIEVLRGPESVLYGSGALGGVLNIITKKRENFDQSVGANGAFITNYSSALRDPYNRGEVSANFQNLGVYAGYSYYSPGSVDAGDVFFPEFTTGYEQQAADIRMDYYLRDIWTLTFDYQYLRQNGVPRTDRFRFLNPRVAATQTLETTNPQQRDFGYLRLQGFDDTAFLLNGLQITFDVQRRIEDIHFTNQAGTIPTRLTEEELHYGGLDARAFTFLGDYHYATYGVTYRYDTSDANRFDRAGSGVVTRATPPLPPDGKYMQFGVFLMDYLSPVDGLWLNFGGRYSNVQAKGTARAFGTGALSPVVFDNSYDIWSGEFGINYELVDGLYWVGNISQGFRAPNLEDLGVAERSTAAGPDNGNINLEPEIAVNYETGFKFNSDWLVGGATIYYSNGIRQIVRQRVAGTNARTNTKGYIWGAEGEWAILLSPNWSIYGVVSYCYGNDETRHEPLRVPPLNGIVGGRWNLPTPNFGLFIDVYGEMMAKFERLGEFDRSDLRIPIGGEPAWQTMNARAGIDAGRWGELTIGYYNWFDQNYRFVGSGVDAPGAEFRVGYEIDF